MILDKDVGYATALSSYIRANKKEIDEIQVFTDVQKFLAYVRTNRVNIAIIGQSVASVVNEELAKADIPILELAEEKEDADREGVVYKYQSAKNILDYVDKRLLTNTHSPLQKEKEKKDNQIISILSPTGSVSTAVIALTMARYMSKEEKILYINLNPCCCLEKILWEQEQKGLSDILYYYRQGAKQVLSASQAFRMLGDIIYIPQVDHYLDLHTMEIVDMDCIIEEAREEFSCTKAIICMKQISAMEEGLLRKSDAIYIEQATVERHNTQNQMLLDMLMARGILCKEEVKELPFIDTNQFDYKDFHEIIFKDNQLDMYIESLINN